MDYMKLIIKKNIKKLKEENKQLKEEIEQLKKALKIQEGFNDLFDDD
jgi:septation ring formation regulator EzrA